MLMMKKISVTAATSVAAGTGKLRDLFDGSDISLPETEAEAFRI